MYRFAVKDVICFFLGHPVISSSTLLSNKNQNIKIKDVLALTFDEEAMYLISTTSYILKSKTNILFKTYCDGWKPSLISHFYGTKLGVGKPSQFRLCGQEFLYL